MRSLISRTTAGGFLIGLLLSIAGPATLSRSGPDAALAAAEAGSQANAGVDPSGVLRQRYADLPLAFVENRGQVDERVRYYAQSARSSFYLTRDAIVLSLASPGGTGDAASDVSADTSDGVRPASLAAAAPPTDGRAGVALALRFLGANPHVALEPERRAPGEVHVLLGDDPSRWQTGLPRHEGIVYRDLWPGIDLALQDRAGTLKYEFRVRAGARVADIQLAWEGANATHVDDGGALRIATDLGVLRDSAPIAYQEVGGARVPVASRYEPSPGGAGRYGFALGASYRPDRDLVLDPGIQYSTFLGGSSHDTGAGIAVDAAGSAYIVGTTFSANFPTRTGSFDRTLAGSNDVFVTKLDAAGSALVYSTYLGGTPAAVPAGGSDPFEFGRAIAVDSSGNAYVTGQTTSRNFPTTANAFDRTLNVGTFDATDAFVVKLNPTGSALVFSTSSAAPTSTTAWASRSTRAGTST
jgi:hypothetical protein